VYPYPGKRTFSVLFISFWLLCTVLSGQTSDAKSSAKNDSESEKIYEVGADVKSPKLVHYVEPAFSPKSKEAYVEGTVRISTVVTRAGEPTNLQVLRGLNAEEDRTALDALKQWRFQPGTRNGQAVNVRVTVEIDFHLL